MEKPKKKPDLGKVTLEFCEFELFNSWLSFESIRMKLAWNVGRMRQAVCFRTEECRDQFSIGFKTIYVCMQHNMDVSIVKFN